MKLEDKMEDLIKEAKDLYARILEIYRKALEEETVEL